MTRQDQMYKWSIYALGLLPIWILDAYLLGRYPIMGVKPMLLMLAVVTVAVLEGALAGAGFGLAGLYQQPRHHHSSGVDRNGRGHHRPVRPDAGVSGLSAVLGGGADRVCLLSHSLGLIFAACPLLCSDGGGTEGKSAHPPLDAPGLSHFPRHIPPGRLG